MGQYHLSTQKGRGRGAHLQLKIFTQSDEETEAHKDIQRPLLYLGLLVGERSQLGGTRATAAGQHRVIVPSLVVRQHIHLN
jgi:hypothetical protein